MTLEAIFLTLVDFFRASLLRHPRQSPPVFLTPLQSAIPPQDEIATRDGVLGDNCRSVWRRGWQRCQVSGREVSSSDLLLLALPLIHGRYWSLVSSAILRPLKYLLTFPWSGWLIQLRNNVHSAISGQRLHLAKITPLPTLRYTPLELPSLSAPFLAGVLLLVLFSTLNIRAFKSETRSLISLAREPFLSTAPSIPTISRSRSARY